MAKGRKIGSNRQERLLGSLDYSQGEGNGASTDVSELGEEDVWSMVDDRVDQDEHTRHGQATEWSSRGPESYEDGTILTRRWTASGGRQVGGLSLAFDDAGKTPSARIVQQFRGQDSMASPRGHHMATSAPVSVPDWPKILRVDSVESMHDSDDGLESYDTEKVPPHEYLARSRKMAATSVFEGVGRTLKGRDLSRVRDAVWSQTGFDG